MRLLALLFLLGVSAFGQAISTPGASTQNPNQVSVSTSYLYYNKMHYAGTWSSTATYNSQDVVVYLGAGYISLQIANTNNLPSSLGLWWVLIPGSGGGGGVWGAITGTLSAQTDLQTALNGKQASLGYTPLNAASNLSDVGSAVTARTNLGLGTAATAAVTTFLQTANNLSDLASALTARTNLGLATVAATGAYSDLSGKPTIPNVTGGSCTSQAVTAISTSVVPTCTTLTSAYVDTSIAKTGADINTSNQVTKTAGVAFAPSATTDTTNATNIGSGTLAAARIASNVRVRAIGYTFDGGGSALSSGVTKYLTVPFACTLSAWNIAVDTGTATIKTWKIATGTAVPTVTNTLSTSGVSIASGTAVHSATMTDFSSTTVTANDIFGFNLFAVSTATLVNFILECDQ